MCTNLLFGKDLAVGEAPELYRSRLEFLTRQSTLTPRGKAAQRR